MKLQIILATGFALSSFNNEGCDSSCKLYLGEKTWYVLEGWEAVGH